MEMNTRPQEYTGNKGGYKWTLYLVAVLLFFIVGGSGYILLKNASQRNEDTDNSEEVQTEKLRICPDSWSRDDSPCVYEESPSECEEIEREYLMIEGRKYKVEEVDIEWIKDNCEVNEPEVVW